MFIRVVLSSIGETCQGRYIFSGPKCPVYKSSGSDFKLWVPSLKIFTLASLGNWNSEQNLIRYIPYSRPSPCPEGSCSMDHQTLLRL